MFTRRTLSFLRSLKKNNDRDWFRARKSEYEQHVRAPMIDVLARLAVDFRTFAPDLVSDPKVSLFRIYRDTRFSSDKSPFKTAVAAHFPSRRFARNEGAGLYFEIAPGWVWIGGGMYMPSTSNLQAIRSQIAATHPRLHRLVTAAPFKKAVGELTGERLTRVPNGYDKDHPAAHYLQFKQFIGGSEYEAAFASEPAFLFGTAPRLQGGHTAGEFPQRRPARRGHAGTRAGGRTADARSAPNLRAASSCNADVVTRTQ